MKLLKKILSFFMLIVLLSVNIGFTYAAEGYNAKQLILAKTELEKINKGDRYIRAIDSLVEKFKLNKEQKKLEILAIRLAEIKNVLVGKTDLRSKSLFAIVHYFDIKVNIALDYFYEEEYQKLSEEEKISDSEMKEIKDKLIKLQLNLLDSGVSYLEEILGNLENLTNYEETGDFNMTLDVNHEQVGKINSSFNLVDYSTKTSNFDSQFSGELNALFDASLSSDQNIKLNLNTMIDFIGKDGNMYLLLEKLSITDEEGLEIIKDKLDTLKEIAEKNEYIKFEDEESTQVMEILSSLTPNKVISDLKVVFSGPMFEPYKKSGDKYYLLPTKYACDKMKELANTFDPFYGNTCSDSQYEDLLEELSDLGEIYIILGDNTEFGFEGIDNGSEKIDSYIVFSDTAIKELNFKLTPNQIKYPSEGILINYKRNNSLNANLYADKGNVNFELKSNLDYNNNFSYINYSGIIKDEILDFTSKLILNNRVIDGEFNLLEKSYNYYNTDSTGEEYIDSNKLIGNISGSVNSLNTLKTLNLDYVGTDLETGFEYIKGDFNYNFGIFSGNTTISDTGIDIISIDHSGQYEKGYLDLNNTFEIVDITGFATTQNETITGNLNFEIDTRNNKNNANIDLEVNSGGTKIIDFNMYNQSIKVFKDIEIEAPTNYINSNDLFPTGEYY